MDHSDPENEQTIYVTPKRERIYRILTYSDNDVICFSWGTDKREKSIGSSLDIYIHTI
jgi:hypothetical protein